MLSIARISSSCTTHLMIMEWNRDFSGDFSGERNGDIIGVIQRFHCYRIQIINTLTINNCTVIYSMRVL